MSGGLVPLKTNATPGGGLFAPASGGGGGGGGSANLVVSTITMNPNSGQIYFPNFGTNQGLLVGYEKPDNTSTTSLSVNFPSGYANKNGAGGVWSILNEQDSANYYGDFAAGRFAVLGNNGGTNVSVPVIDADTNGQMSINAVSTINFSTPTLLLNGAPIGGGGGASIGTSSITASTINFPATSNSGLFYPADGAVVQNDVGISLTPLTGQYGNTGVVGAWGKEVYQGAPGFAEFAAQRYYVTDVTGGKTNQTYIENAGNQIQIQTPSSISLQADTYITGNLNTSSLSVSSINGGSLVLPNLSSVSITTSSLSVSSINGGSLPTTAVYTFNGYNQGGNAVTLDPKKNWFSVVNGYGTLNLLFPEGGTGGWVGNSKFWDLSQLGVASGPGGQPFASGCKIGSSAISAVNDNIGTLTPIAWSQPAGAQLNWYIALNGGPSSFSVTANITF